VSAAPGGTPEPNLSETYNRSAPVYRSVRPEYPPEVFDAIASYAGLGSDALVVEVGVGTGQATRRLAERGWNVLGVEPGADLAAIARDDLGTFANVEIRTCRFEDAAVPDHSVDLVAAATSWHWVDADVGSEKAARMLRGTGAIALWWNAHVPDTTSPRWAPIRAVYEEVAPELAHLAPLTPNDPTYDPVARLVASARFDGLESRVFPFSVDYDVGTFLGLLDTYVSHQRLDDERRASLYANLAAVARAELDGVITKPYEAFLVLARPKR
jgi:SAM-dependent methyltransferase